MASDRFGVWLDSYRLDLKSALRRAATDGFRALQVSAVTPDFDPAQLSQSGERHLLRYLSGLGLRLDALGAVFPGDGLADPQDGERRLRQLQRTLALCRRLNVPGTLVSLSGIDRPDSPAREMLGRAAELASAADVQLHILGAEPPPAQLAALDQLRCPRLDLALDTASFDPAAFGPEAARRVGVVHLRDVRRMGSAVEEVDFGRGGVDFRALFRALEKDGPAPVLAVRRDSPLASIDDLRRGVDYLQAARG